MISPLKSFIYLFTICLLVSCGSSEKNQELDLMQYDMPIKIKAPIDSKVVSTDYGFAKDVTVKSGEDYDIQIISSDAMTQDLPAIVAEKKREVEDGLYFSKIIEEDDFGFIFEKKISAEKVKYDFRKVKLQGDKEYVFQSGIVGNFDVEQIRKMYNSI